MDVKGIVVAIVAICVITVVMGAALGGVYSVTKNPIEKAQEQAKNDAYAEVLPEATRIMSVEEDGNVVKQINPLLESYGFEDVHIDDICVGGDDEKNELVGYVILITSTAGYGGDIQMAIGINTEYQITGISFLTLNETAGLGMEADTDEFKSQFIGKQVNKFEYTKTGSTKDSEIDALSGATITTSAVTNAVNAALRTIRFLTTGGAQ
ncbi:MAG: RnfABCDGE type electron transport complex subunit G [Wujia sp.]|nr:RnfABCDGE type electron transport complex subunit G [Wujia sp.]MDD7283387.1 RnfABCDGE type electron transport complex subunit G [Clostridium sp.]MDY3726845.1 RnfABCDGE type electron transport complex subunit G [Wujia sp.]